jgi:hypothetical protein
MSLLFCKIISTIFVKKTMAKRNGKIDKRANKLQGRSKRPRPTVADNRPTVGRDKPLPPTLPSHLKPYDTNNDGVISQEERIAMLKAQQKEKREGLMKKNIEERREEMKRRP